LVVAGIEIFAEPEDENSDADDECLAETFFGGRLLETIE
jgi:hypothetical protein